MTETETSSEETLSVQTLLACFQKLLAPAIVDALTDSFAPEHLSDGHLPTQAFDTASSS